MKEFLLPRLCRPIGIAIWAGAIIWGMGLIYEWIHTTPEWAHSLIGPKLIEEGFEFPTWSRLIDDQVQTTAPNGEICRYGDSSAHIFNPLFVLAICIGTVLIFFSKQRVEDEMSLRERLNSLMIAFVINITLFILAYACAFLPNGTPYFLIQIAANNFAVFITLLPAVYLIREWILKRSCNKEEIIL